MWVGSLNPVDILLLISELEGSYQKCKALQFTDDMLLLEEMKSRYYKLYYKLKKNDSSKQDSQTW